MVDDNDTCNRVKREPASSPDSIAPLNEQYWAKKVKKEIIEEANRPSLMVDVDKVKAKKKVKVKKKEPDYICCNKTDGKGWFCKKEAKEGEVLCEHHIEQLKSYQFNYTYSCRKSTKAKPEVATATAAAAATTTITTTIASKKRNRGKVSSPSPMDFYYYSGFGPKYSWGSRRRAGGGSGDNIKEIKKEENDVDDTNTNIAEASSSSAVHVVDLHDYDDVFDDFDEDEDDEYNGDKKRVRRPVKARSLKSLF
ncbi:Growth-regulating factor like [Thalictrum thalictroides]|uniref:Growth-regulating factor like n=1 Tax=Thalictrum thalictroides TaxID=46969 RepID=A0A7J6VIL4_THATH|nr:Growth-regulating factor like [Thalictrum thalictroides]